MIYNLTRYHNRYNFPYFTAKIGKNIDFTKNKYAIEDKGLCNNNLLHHYGKCHLAFLVVFEAEGATMEAEDLARDGEADA